MKGLLKQALIAAFAFISVYLVVDTWVGYKIDKRLSERIIPFMIFNQNRIIISDQDATRYVSERIIIGVDSVTQNVHTITIQAKQHLDIPPLLECLGPDLYFIEAVPGPEFTWRYNLNPIMSQGTGNNMFRLEILR